MGDFHQTNTPTKKGDFHQPRVTHDNRKVEEPHRPPSVQKGKNILVIFLMISKAGQKRAGRIWSWKRRGRLCEPKYSLAI